MNWQLKRLMNELRDAINGPLANSDRLFHALARIREEGYDVHLVLEARVGSQLRPAMPGFEERSITPIELPNLASECCPPAWPITAHDARFLKALRIVVDDAA